MNSYQKFFCKTLILTVLGSQTLVSALDLLDGISTDIEEIENELKFCTTLGNNLCGLNIGDNVSQITLVNGEPAAESPYNRCMEYILDNWNDYEIIASLEKFTNTTVRSKAYEMINDHICAFMKSLVVLYKNYKPPIEACDTFVQDGIKLLEIEKEKVETALKKMDETENRELREIILKNIDEKNSIKRDKNEELKSLVTAAYSASKIENLNGYGFYYDRAQILLGKIKQSSNEDQNLQAASPSSQTQQTGETVQEDTPLIKKAKEDLNKIIEDIDLQFNHIHEAYKKEKQNIMTKYEAEKKSKITSLDQINNQIITKKKEVPYENQKCISELEPFGANKYDDGKNGQMRKLIRHTLHYVFYKTKGKNFQIGSYSSRYIQLAKTMFYNNTLGRGTYIDYTCSNTINKKGNRERDFPESYTEYKDQFVYSCDNEILQEEKITLENNVYKPRSTPINESTQK